MKRTIALSLTALCALTASTFAGGVTTGEAAPDFTLTDTHGKKHSLSNFKGKHVVLEWTNDGCPFVVKHYTSDNMQNLQKKYTEKGVVWLSICSSAEGKQGHKSNEAWNQLMAKQGAAPTALLVDEDGTVGMQYAAKTTPHMYIINPKGVLVYQGAIDSIRSANPGDIDKAENYVVSALDASLAGKAVATTDTKPYGCSVKYKR